MYDLIIIGAGPAGMTAAVYAARKRLNTLVLSIDVGGQTLWSSVVENYLGYNYISGLELVKKFNEHIEQYNIEKKAENVIGIEAGKPFKIKTASNEYEGKAVIIATGKKPRQLNIPGERDFIGKGVAYCATCDAPLFAEKNVAVIGGGNSALDAAIQLTKIARKVYLINIEKNLTADPVLVEKIKDKATIFNSAKTIAITGDKFVDEIKIETDGKKQGLNVQGVFIEIGLIPNSEFVNIIEKNVDNEIIVNNRNETSLHGLFAAGDVTNVPSKQIIVAAGEGAKAALAAADYIDRN